MRYELLLADADGTLFDFHAGERAAIRATLRAFALPEDDGTAALYSACNAAQWLRLERGETTSERLRVDRFADFLRQLDARGVAAARSADAGAMAERFMGMLSVQRALLPGAEALCRAVSARMPIYLITNGIARVQHARFDACALSRYLSGLVISEEVGRQKPAPDMIYAAMRLSGVADARRVVVLGDSLSADVAAANNAGVDSIWYTGGAPIPRTHPATFAVRELPEAERYILQP